jgi:hypothetical protein
MRIENACTASVQSTVAWWTKLLFMEFADERGQSDLPLSGQLVN